LRVADVHEDVRKSRDVVKAQKPSGPWSLLRGAIIQPPHLPCEEAAVENSESMTQMVGGLASAIALLVALCEPPEAPGKFERLLGPLIEACGEDEPLKRRTLELLRQRIRVYAG